MIYFFIEQDEVSVCLKEEQISFNRLYLSDFIGRYVF